MSVTYCVCVPPISMETIICTALLKRRSAEVRWNAELFEFDPQQFECETRKTATGDLYVRTRTQGSCIRVCTGVQKTVRTGRIYGLLCIRVVFIGLPA